MSNIDTSSRKVLSINLWFPCLFRSLAYDSQVEVFRARLFDTGCLCAVKKVRNSPMPALQKAFILHRAHLAVRLRNVILVLLMCDE